jgi:hypothetical protein
LRAFKRDLMLRYLYLIPDGFSCISTMSLAFWPISTRWPMWFRISSASGAEISPIKDTYQYLLTVIRVVSYFNPLHVFIPISLGLIGFSVLKSLFDLL